MTRRLKNAFLASGAFVAALGFTIAVAQEPPQTPALPEAPVAIEVEQEASPATQAPTPPPTPEAAAEPVMNPDEMADFLNSKQQIRQDVTLTRTVDGKVVETTKETVVYSADDPYRGSEAGLSPLEQLKAEFDSKALTRKEALEEAKLDFIVADLDRDEAMSAAEFSFLVKGWQDAEITGSGRGRFVDPIFHADQAAADAEHAAQAQAKFTTVAGADPAIGRKPYIKAVIADFDAADVDEDGLLRGEELLQFRAANRGEPYQP